MARHKHHKSSENPGPALEIASLIDVCFLLLIYFIATSTITPREADLGLALPGYETIGTPSHVDPVSIRIKATGEILAGAGDSQQVMDTDPATRELPLLRGQLELVAAASRAAGTEPAVRIQADEQTTQQRVIDVLDTLAATGIRMVTFSDTAF
jgi:biopolymer transport protein ExbD